jgi:nicotinate-nucleotide pyrophosphorylase (carboxylating)
MSSGQADSGLSCYPNLNLISLALAEDLGKRGDITSQAFIPAESVSLARIVSREKCIVSGLSTAVEVFRQIDPQLEVTLCCAEGDRLSIGDTLMELKGSTRSILSGERTALNFLGRLCGVATLSGRYADELQGGKVTLLDTRKTTPGWRLLEKQAVKAGGCTNHRMGLHDAVLVKDNHLAALGSLDALPGVISKLRAEHPGLPIEIEADTLEQLERLLAMKGIDVVLLDNMDTAMMRNAVVLRNNFSPGVLLEASGGVKLANLRQIADTGVDRISVGALTHSAPNADLSLELGHAG